MTALDGHAVVVTGEALVDLVLAHDGSMAGHPGGGPYNVARTIGRLEQPVAYLGRVSTDGFGKRLRRELGADGVGLSALVATDAPTTLALAELDAAGAAQYRFYEAGTSAPGLSLEAASAALPDHVDTFYLGTPGLVFEPLASTLEALVAGMRDGTLVALDPNCRPTAIADPAAFRGRLDRLLARTDVVKASEEDLAWIDPGADPVTAARAARPGARCGARHARRRWGARDHEARGGRGALAEGRCRGHDRRRRRLPWARSSPTGAGAASAVRTSTGSTTSSRGRGSPAAWRQSPVRAGADPPRLAEL